MKTAFCCCCYKHISVQTPSPALSPALQRVTQHPNLVALEAMRHLEALHLEIRPCAHPVRLYSCSCNITFDIMTVLPLHRLFDGQWHLAQWIMVAAIYVIPVCEPRLRIVKSQAPRRMMHIMVFCTIQAVHIQRINWELEVGVVADDLHIRQAPKVHRCYGSTTCNQSHRDEWVRAVRHSCATGMEASTPKAMSKLEPFVLLSSTHQVAPMQDAQDIVHYNCLQNTYYPTFDQLVELLGRLQQSPEE
jgi:hypothetical protein